MISFLGPAEAVTIAPFCTVEDIAAWVPTHRVIESALIADSVWRQLLASHFCAAFNHLSQSQDVPSSPEKMAAQLPESNLRQVYMSLRKASSTCPFVLQPRARLQLEIHELREWDRHRKLFLLQRQAARLAEAFSNAQALDRLRVEMGPPALELVSLHTMMSEGRSMQLSQIEEVAWDVSAEASLRQLMEKRIQQRRSWWQRQRDFLMQDLGG